jgi:intracellular sulfur oxidation DsrE/DsrF family protein
MNRRGVLGGVFSAMGGLLGAAGVTKASAEPALARSKVVYHLVDLDKVGFVLGNIKNHYDGVGGPANVTIALVVHGPALKSFHTANANPQSSKQAAELAKAGVQFTACGNTMKSQNIALNDLLPGFVVAEAGGVVRLAELQSQGYVYLRP